MKFIEVSKARQNNLKSVDVRIPWGTLTSVCGLSGSGKSSLAFDTLYAEGQRRYLQNLSNYLKQYIIMQNPPDVDSISNLPPALALEQKNSVRNYRSSVASFSGIADQLRLIFENLSKPHCPKHKLPLKSFNSSEIVSSLLKEFEGQRAFTLIPVLEGERPNSQVFLKSLKQKGCTKLLIPKKEGEFSLTDAKDIEEVKRLPKKEFYVLFDRFVLKKETEERLRDSFRQALKFPSLFSLEENCFSSKILVQVLDGELRHFSLSKSCPKCSYIFPLPITFSLFSSNSPLGACETCEGSGYTLEFDESKIVPNPKLSLRENAIHPFSYPSAARWKTKMRQFCDEKNISWTKNWCDLTASERRLIWQGKGSFKGLQSWFDHLYQKRYKMHIRIMIARYKSHFTCKTCKGSRLRKELSHIYFYKKTFNDFMAMTLGQMQTFFDKTKFEEEETKACSEAFSALKRSLKNLNALGLSYLTLNRSTKTLSGGEFQRLNLSGQLGLCLSQVLYVLDEPTVGLHPRDSHRMIELLKELKSLGNTVVVVEHDGDVIRNSDYVIEMGPLSGAQGGEVLWQGESKNFFQNKNSNTVPYLTRDQIPLKSPRPVNKETYKYKIEMEACKGNNLKSVNLFIPLNRFVAVSGLSGSGKSSLITKTLYPALKSELTEERLTPLPFKKLSGSHFLKDVILMDQSGTSKSSRSLVVSYIKAFDVVRQLFSQTAEAERKGYTASFFSLNVEGGRCPSCQGRGYEEIDMLFMDSIKTQCEVCEGKKFKKEMLSVRLEDYNICDILDMTVDEALLFFKKEAVLLRAFSSLKEVGLSYLRLGQSLSSLSGGEIQRLKLSRELLKTAQEKTLYILDEPTKGLHFKELELLLKVIDRLTETGGSFLVIEHNLDLLKEADYIIDMGPEAGKQGGRIIYEGQVQGLLNTKKSYTGQFLNQWLNSFPSKK